MRSTIMEKDPPFEQHSGWGTRHDVIRGEANIEREERL